MIQAEKPHEGYRAQCRIEGGFRNGKGRKQNPGVGTLSSRCARPGTGALF